MTFEDASDALLSHFFARWAVLNPTVPVDPPNGILVSAVDGTPADVSSDTDPWVRVRFTPTFSTAISIGSRRNWRDEGGRALVTVSVPLRSGTAALRAYQADIKSIWDDAYANGLSGDVHLSGAGAVPEFRDPDVPAWNGGVSVAFHSYHKP